MHSLLFFLIPFFDWTSQDEYERETRRFSRRFGADKHDPTHRHFRHVFECSSPQWAAEGGRSDEEEIGDGDFYDDDDTDGFSALEERGGEHVPDWQSSMPSRRNGTANRVSSGGGNRSRIQTGRGTFSSRRDDNGRNDRTNNIRRKKHSPVVYQYFAANRGPTSPDGLHFILLGPNVEHWEIVGQILSSRGFNVMACERVEEEVSDLSMNRGRDTTKTIDNDAPELVLDIMDALKWNRVVLVGCDEEAILAIETTMMLAPENVAGVILCGDLSDANRRAKEASGYNVLDTFLHRNLDCPFVIVWDGGAQSVVSGSSAHDAVESASSHNEGRCVILGGGSAPHRTKPEQFAWILTRFVEEKLDYHPRDHHHSNFPRRTTRMDDMLTDDETDPGDISGRPSSTAAFRQQNSGGILQNLNLPFGINSIVSAEGRLLLGRAVAAALFYISFAKVIVVQYGNIRSGLISVKSSVDSVDALRRKIFQVVGAFVVNFGYLPRLFKFSFKRTREVDEDDIGRGQTDPIEKDVKQDTKDSSLNSAAEEDLNSAESVSPEHDGSGDAEKNEVDDEEERPRFKPFFFLDNIIT